MPDPLRAFIITMPNHSESSLGFRKCLASIKATGTAVQPFMHIATTPDTIVQDTRRYLPFTPQWTWPLEDKHSGFCIKTGLYKKPYKANDQNKVIACAISHMVLWQLSIEIDEPILILEHDSIFIDKFTLSRLGTNPQIGVCSINDPAGATRKASVYRQSLLMNRVPDENGDIQPVKARRVDQTSDRILPQGLPGNSAYVIMPWFAKKVMEKVQDIGLWPNDALLCRELFEPHVFAHPLFFTTLSGVQSTTTG